ncbi:hypothetical protein GF338_06475 [candidate division WOR-3 bacterium]|nr:hypothetical protein [candidate division WOR-3 bacterium]
MARLTEAQRKVLETFKFRWSVLTVKEIYKDLDGNVSVMTIRRALARLCSMRILKRVKAERRGRGYSAVYCWLTDEDEEEQREQEAVEKTEPEPEPDEDALAELNETIAAFDKAIKKLEKGLPPNANR